MAYQGKTDWTKDDIVRPDDMNRIEQGIEDAQSSIDNISKSLTPESIGAAKKSDFDNHVQDNTRHITTAERNTWNGKETPDGAQQKADAAETNAKNYVNGLQWQRKKVSDDAGNANVVSDLNADLTTGWYMGSNMANAPTSEWFWVEIIRHNHLWTVQNAYCFNRTSYYQRMKINGNWTPWSQDLFQSVVDGKGQVAAAINGKGGGPVSANSTFPQLADGINKINTGAVLTASGEIMLGKNEIGYKEITMFTIPASVKDFSMYIMSSNDGITIQNFDSNKPEVYSRFFIKNLSGSIDLFVLSEHSGIERGTYNFNNFSFNKNTRTVLISGDAYRNSQNNIIQFSKEIPSNFDLNQDVKIMLSIETRVENWWEMHSVFRNMRAIMV